MSERLRVRSARPADVHGIATLVNGYAAQAVMLPRSIESIEIALDDFVVAVDPCGRVMACGALKMYSPSLAEVASLAVSQRAHGRGVGRSIVEAVESLAQARGVDELFALTLTSGFFEAAGYVVTDRASYPEKVRRDCMGCARRAVCIEVCVSRMLAARRLEAA